METIKLKELKDTEQFAAALAKKIHSPCTVGLIGDLGAGKTTFSRFFLKYLGCKEEVTSPTFVLQHIYKTPSGEISHWDLYRLKSLPEELLEDLDANKVVLIEWADKFPSLLAACNYVISIKLVHGDKPDLMYREVIINRQGS